MGCIFENFARKAFISASLALSLGIFNNPPVLAGVRVQVPANSEVTVELGNGQRSTITNTDPKPAIVNFKTDYNKESGDTGQQPQSTLSRELKNTRGEIEKQVSEQMIGPATTTPAIEVIRFTTSDVPTQQDEVPSCLPQTIPPTQERSGAQRTLGVLQGPAVGDGQLRGVNDTPAVEPPNTNIPKV